MQATNSRDLAPPPDGIFDTLEEAIEEMDAWAQPRGYAVTQANTSKNAYGKTA